MRDLITSEMTNVYGGTGKSRYCKPKSHKRHKGGNSSNSNGKKGRHKNKSS